MWKNILTCSDLTTESFLTVNVGWWWYGGKYHYSSSLLELELVNWCWWWQDLRPCRYSAQPPVWPDSLFVSDQAKSATNQGDVFSQLWSASRDLSNGKFVKNISIYPSLQLTLVHPDMTREFEEHGPARQSYLINPSVILHIINPWCPSSMRKL